MSEAYHTQPLPWLPTDPHRVLQLATCRGVHLTATTLWPITFAAMCEEFSQTPAVSEKKGRGYLTGPASPERKAKNLPFSDIAVLDADSTQLPNGATEKGAPDPVAVHERLKLWNISHLLVTTHSHRDNCSRYRVIFPMHTANQQELSALMMYLVHCLQDTGIPVALTRESTVWSQQWFFPQLAYIDAPFYCAHHVGVLPDPTWLAQHYNLVDQDGKPYHQEAVHQALHAWTGYEENINSFDGIWNKFVPLDTVLTDHGYTFVSRGTAASTTGDGESVYAERWARPGSDKSDAGVIVFRKDLDDPRPVVWSHHQNNDPLSRARNGRALDSYHAYIALSGFDQGTAIRQMEQRIAEVRAAKMQIEYPAILYGSSKFKIGNLCVDEFGALYYGLMAQSDFRSAVAGEPPMITMTQTDNQTMKASFQSLADWWLTTRMKTVHKGMTYQPCHLLAEPVQPVLRDIDNLSEKGKFFNVFRGWGFKPKPGKWDLLREHLFEAICGGRQEEYDYMLNWFAHLVQYPWLKPGVALVIRGGKGWGKSMIFQSLARLMAQHSVILGNNKQLTGQFNAHLNNKLLAVVEESFYAAAAQQEGVLKHLITDEITTYEAKGIDATQGKSVIRVVLITNLALAAPASADERRFFIPSVCEASYLKDKIGGKKGHFFPKLAEEMNNGGMIAFLYDMAHREISANCVVNVPETPGLSYQRAQMLNGMEALFFEMLSAGEITLLNGNTVVWGERPVTLRESDLLGLVKNSLDVYSRQRNPSFRMEQALRELFGGSTVRDGVYRTLPALSQARKFFTDATKISPDCFTGTVQPLTLPTGRQ